MSLREPPLIGIAAAEVRPAQTIRRVREGEPVTHETTIGLEYVAGTAGAGAIPVVLPVTDPEVACSTLSRVDGLCLPGGPDIDPEFYGQRRTAQIGPSQPRVDRFQLDLARAALRLGMPLLAICRGMQTLNVTLGGTLIPHLPAEPQVSLSHRQEEPGNVAAHVVRVSPDSTLAAITGRTELDVNTFHHQAIRELGEGLVPVAWSEDEVIEAVETKDDGFVLGVQWHAELMLDGPDSRAIFEWFAEAAREYRSRRPEGVTA